MVRKFPENIVIGVSALFVVAVFPIGPVTAAEGSVPDFAGMWEIGRAHV